MSCESPKALFLTCAIEDTHKLQRAAMLWMEFLHYVKQKNAVEVSNGCECQSVIFALVQNVNAMPMLVRSTVP